MRVAQRCTFFAKAVGGCVVGPVAIPVAMGFFLERSQLPLTRKTDTQKCLGEMRFGPLRSFIANPPGSIAVKNEQIAGNGHLRLIAPTWNSDLSLRQAEAPWRVTLGKVSKAGR